MSPMHKINKNEELGQKHTCGRLYFYHGMTCGSHKCIPSKLCSSSGLSNGRCTRTKVVTNGGKCTHIQYYGEIYVPSPLSTIVPAVTAVTTLGKISLLSKIYSLEVLSLSKAIIFLPSLYFFFFSILFFSYSYYKIVYHYSSHIIPCPFPKLSRPGYKT